MKKNLLILLLMVMFVPNYGFAQSADKTLVAYFSASGVTENIAKQLARELECDIFKIEPQNPYTDADLDWRDKNSRSSIEMKDKSSRPNIAKKIENMQQYNRILIGFPIWWYTCPTIINTFMENHDFSNILLIPFATSGGSSIKQACNDLKSTYPQYNWQEGKLLNHRKDITDFINSLK